MDIDTFIDKLPLDVRRGRLAVEMDWFEEGRNGTYDPNNPEDVPLVRVEVNVDGELVDDASVKTNLPATEDAATLERAAFKLVDEIEPHVRETGDPRPIVNAVDGLTTDNDLPDDNLPVLTADYLVHHLHACANALVETVDQDKNGHFANAETLKALYRAVDMCDEAGSDHDDVLHAARGLVETSELVEDDDNRVHIADPTKLVDAVRTHQPMVSA